MRIIRTVKKMIEYSCRAKAGGKLVGLVPTMGALHEGHLSLVRKSIEENDVTVVSIFVNPAQFGRGEDYSKYPRNLRADAGLCSKAGVDVIFYPSVKEMYPGQYGTYVEVEGLPDRLCGRSRPGHFRGVCTVVSKLFNAVLPHSAYFGQKDFQQFIIIKKMTKDLNFPVKARLCPTRRETDGLAMSSRNAYLSKPQRREAARLRAALKAARRLIKKKGIRPAGRIIREMKKIIEASPLLKIDYIHICDRETLRDLKTARKGMLIAVAVYAGKTRIIDNDIY